jgi:hypothetical protein
MVIVNTVVIVRGLGLGQRDVALTLAAFGGGSMCAAFARASSIASPTARS